MSAQVSTPPACNIDAERAVLAAVLLDCRQIAEVDQIVRPEHFYDPKHRAVWEAILALDKRGSTPDAVLVAQWLRDAGRADEVPISYLAELVDSVPAVANVAEHARIVAGHAKVRGIERLVRLIAVEARSGVGDPEAWSQDVERRVYEACQSVRAEESLHSLKDLVQAEQVAIGERANAKRELAGLSSGIASLDALLGGWLPGLKYEIGARPGMGKTGLALTFALEAAKAGPVVFISVEMPGAQLTQRAIAQFAGVDCRDIASGRINSGDWPRIVGAFGALAKLPLFVEEAGEQTPAGIRSAVRRAMSRVKRSGDERPLQMILLDYLQLVDPDTRPSGKSRDERVGEVSAATRQMAKQFHCPVVELAQLNRDCEKRPDKRPTLPDLRESGNIEQDAYAIIFLYRDDYYRAKGEQKFMPTGDVELIVAKNRNGPFGTARCSFEERTTRFFQAPTREELLQADFDEMDIWRNS